jgi:hypothetical protein
MHAQSGLWLDYDLGSLTELFRGISAVARKSVTLGERLMRGPHSDRVLVSTALSLMLAAPLGAFAQDSNEPAATFNERFPADQTSTQPSLEIPEAKKEQNVTTTTRVVSAKRPRARVTVAPRSFLDAGTEVLPGERKFTDYAFPVGPYSMPLSVVQSTGGRVGWHQSPLPAPFDLPSRNNPFGW